MSHEAPALCYHCGAEIDDVTVLLYGSFCSGPCSEAHGLRVVQELELFRFTRDGIDYICAWHPGFDRTHPANRDANHGLCDSCMERGL